MAADKPFLGIVLMIAFCALAPMGDAIAKYLGGSVPLAELLLARFTVQALVLIPVLKLMGLTIGMPAWLFGLTVLRTVLHIVGIGAMFLALRYLPLADALAIAFVLPFIILLFGKLFAGETVGARRLAACAVGFAGTLLVIQPSFAEVGAPALLPLVVAVAFALFMLVTRKIARDTDPISLQAMSGIVATVILAVTVCTGTAGGVDALTMIRPSDFEVSLLIAVGILGTVAHLVMTWSLKYAPSATVAPVQYLEIPFATVIGWIVFDDLPDGLAALGMAVIMSAGVYIVLRERKIARTLASDPATI